MPDWWAVFELNYEGADFWGRDVDSVSRNAREWHAEYVIVYEERDGVLGNDWEGAGFRALQEFRWDAYVGDASSNLLQRRSGGCSKSPDRPSRNSPELSASGMMRRLPPPPSYAGDEC